MVTCCPPTIRPSAPEDLNALYPGIWPRGARRSGGVLTLGGMDVRDLAAEFGTPLYVCDEEDVRSRCRDYLEAFGPDGRVFYAAKAFCSRAVLRWVSSEGLGVDVCTGGELEVALSAGVSPDQITLHGNNKTLDELSRAVCGRRGPHRGGLVRGDRPARVLDGSCPGRPPDPTGRPAKPSVLVRVTTGVEAHTHEFMATAHDDQKFGFSLASGAADEAVRRVIACPGLEFAGLHSHIGSQIFDTAGFEVAAQPGGRAGGPDPRRARHRDRRARPRRRVRHRLHRRGRRARGQGAGAEPARRSWTASAGLPGWPGPG